MLVNNGGGLPQGDTDNPELIAQPRGGIPAVIDTREGLEKAARALAQGSTPIALDVERAQGFRYGSDPYLVQIRREDVGCCTIVCRICRICVRWVCVRPLCSTRRLPLASWVWSVSVWRRWLSRCWAWAS